MSAWVRISAAMPGMPKPNATRGNVTESATAPRMFEPFERIIHRRVNSDWNVTVSVRLEATSAHTDARATRPESGFTM